MLEKNDTVFVRSFSALVIDTLVEKELSDW